MQRHHVCGNETSLRPVTSNCIVTVAGQLLENKYTISQSLEGIKEQVKCYNSISFYSPCTKVSIALVLRFKFGEG
jgi:hypothetical protein